MKLPIILVSLGGLALATPLMSPNTGQLFRRGEQCGPPHALIANSSFIAIATTKQIAANTPDNLIFSIQ